MLILSSHRLHDVSLLLFVQFAENLYIFRQFLHRVTFGLELLRRVLFHPLVEQHLQLLIALLALRAKFEDFLLHDWYIFVPRTVFLKNLTAFVEDLLELARLFTQLLEGGLEFIKRLAKN